MMQHWIFREPTLALGLPVYICAAVVFPLHLGWTGASLLAFAAYLLVAAVLLAAADVLGQPGLYPGWGALLPQSMLSVLALAVPAGLAFALGALVGPVEERLEDQVCLMEQSGSSQAAADEADDIFDVTADCVPRTLGMAELRPG